MKLRILSFCVVTTLLATYHTDILTSQSAMIPYTQIRPSILRSIGSALWRTTRTITAGSPRFYTSLRKAPKLSFVAMTLTGIASYLWWRSHRPQQHPKPGQLVAAAAPQPTIGTEPIIVVPLQEAAAASQEQSTPAPQRISTRSMLDVANFNIPQLINGISTCEECTYSWELIKEAVAKSLSQDSARPSYIGTDKQIYSFLETLYPEDITREDISAQKNLAYIKYAYEEMEMQGETEGTKLMHRYNYLHYRTKLSAEKPTAQQSSSQALQFNSEAPQQ